MKFTPVRRSIRFDGTSFQPTEYEPHELVSDKYDREVNRKIKRAPYEKRYGRKRPDKFYVVDDTDYRGFRALKQEEIEAIQLAEAQVRHAKR